jgi:3-deoxy-D-manno-octulosonic-acid transferase
MGLYRLATDLGAPLIASLLRHRLAAGREDPVRFPERLGFASQKRPDGTLIWCHAASVGEAMSVLALLEALGTKYPSFSFLLTTGTVTSARLLVDRLPPRTHHQFVPVDRWPYVTRFLHHWRPDAALWVESELWPNMLQALSERHIPVCLVNGRMSARSFRRWSWIKPVIRDLLSPFALCLVQTDDEKKRYEALGARKVETAGNLKYAAAPLAADSDALQALHAACGKRPVWVMASTHPGEEDIALRTHQKLRERLPDLLTIVVPRHPNRAESIAAALAPYVPLARRSRNEPLDSSIGLYLVDTMGELGLFYRLAPVTCLGGSFTWGGHNPIEPAQLGSAILAGPNMKNFQVMNDAMKQAGALIQLADESELAPALEQLLTSSDARARLTAAALTFAEEKRNVLPTILDRLDPYLAASRGR